MADFEIYEFPSLEFYLFTREEEREVEGNRVFFHIVKADGVTRLPTAY